MILGFMAIPITVGATLVLPWLVIRIVDDHLMKDQFEGFSELVWSSAGIILLGYVADAVYTFSLQKTGQIAIYELRKELYKHILSLPRIFFDQRCNGRCDGCNLKSQADSFQNAQQRTENLNDQ